MCSISNGKILRHSLTDVVNIDCAHSIYRIIVFFYLFIACNIPYKCQWKRWRNCCLGNNNNHFGIIVTHVGNCVSVCVCNEVVLVNTKCAPEKRSVAIVNVVRLTTIWRLIKGIRLHIWRELANTRNWLLCTFWRQFWWEKSSACAIKDITKWILFFFFVVVVEFTVSEDLIKIIGADWKEFSDVDECSHPLHRAILFRWFLFVSFSQLNQNILFGHAKWTNASEHELYKSIKKIIHQ